MTISPEQPDSGHAPKRCVRCGYSQRGLPARHRCPECGLGYDENSGWFPVTNPRAALLVWLCIFCGGWMNLRYLPVLGRMATASTGKRVLALLSLLWIVFVVIFVVVLVRRYRQGQGVAVTADGLIVRLIGFKSDLVPWDRVGEAEVKELATTKPQVVSVFFHDKGKTVDIGGHANVFPKRADAERFTAMVNARQAGADRGGAGGA